MSMFTLAISCLAISCLTMSHSNLPWFMDLLFQILMQYWSLQHQTLLSPPDTSTAEWSTSLFGPAASFFLELLVISLCFYYIEHLPTGDSSSSIIFFCLFILSLGFFRQEYWNELQFPSPLDHVLSELFTMTHSSCVALHGRLKASLS